MGFLNNNGDIILDAVLTDLGRQRLAAGDGSFRVVKFALSDDEIDYSLYNPTAETGQRDSVILSTPIFESFTNNFSVMKSRLLTIPRSDLKYLPVVKVNTNSAQGSEYSNSSLVSNGFVVSVDKNTYDNLKSLEVSGYEISTLKKITLDQGYDNAATLSLNNLPADLAETQFLIEIDNRLGTVLNSAGATIAYSYLDDDSIATYLAQESNQFVSTISGDISNANSSALAGVAYRKLQFHILPSSNLQNSNYLFDTIGQTVTISGASYRVIRANVTVTGLTTGYSVEIPVSFYKKV
jgi:hypothetical protein